MHHLHQEQQLPCSLKQAWEFFSDPRNLEKLTPSSVGFTITYCTEGSVHEGQTIAYKIKLAPLLKVNWLTEISHVIPEEKFIDIQLHGPYKVWHHTHSFEENEHGVLMRDSVTYVLPFGILGKIVHALFVKRQLEHIFAERKRLCAAIFPAKNGSKTP